MKKILVILVCLAMTLSVSGPALAAENEIDTLSELEAAIEGANDGDLLMISRSLSISTPTTIGSAEKSVALCAADGVNAELEISADVVFQNIHICGSSISHSSLTIHQYSGETTFNDVWFLYAYGDTPKSAFAIDSGAALFSNCYFEGGQAENGGFIFIGNSASVILQDTTMSNGYASGNGGAICAYGSLSVDGGQMNSCTCEGLGAVIWHYSDIVFENCGINFAYSPSGFDIFP